MVARGNGPSHRAAFGALVLLVGGGGCVPSGAPLPPAPEPNTGEPDVECTPAPGTWCPMSSEGAPEGR
ncbi:MAG TPA: hypothetical protein VG389_10190, partial [Myxococcota bacterium]|nr:hypothetical protein [Myxococcota bacterium]